MFREASGSPVSIVHVTEAGCGCRHSCGGLPLRGLNWSSTPWDVPLPLAPRPENSQIWRQEKSPLSWLGWAQRRKVLSGEGTPPGTPGSLQALTEDGEGSPRRLVGTPPTWHAGSQLGAAPVRSNPAVLSCIGHRVKNPRRGIPRKPQWDMGSRDTSQ